mgnify:CR=1 FL=1
MSQRRTGEYPQEIMLEHGYTQAEFDWEKGIIPDDEVTYSNSRSGGPGGQGVNTTDSRVEIRWNIKESHSLSEDQKKALRVYAKAQARKKFIESEDTLQFVVSNERSQFQNKKKALQRLISFVKKALTPEEKRIATYKPPRIKKKERRESEADKKRKAGRGRVTNWE